jgi:hypothetical protein
MKTTEKYVQGTTIDSLWIARTLNRRQSRKVPARRVLAPAAARTFRPAAFRSRGAPALLRILCKRAERLKLFPGALRAALRTFARDESTSTVGERRTSLGRLTGASR